MADHVTSRGEGVEVGDELTSGDADTSQGCAVAWRPGSHWTHAGPTMNPTTRWRLRRPDCGRAS
jgi:hypothetical protein